MMLKCRWICKELCQFSENYRNIVGCKNRRDKSKQAESCTGRPSKDFACFFVFCGLNHARPRGPPFVSLIERQKHEMEDHNAHLINRMSVVDDHIDVDLKQHLIVEFMLALLKFEDFEK